jgi:hypothetical protein
VADPRSVADAVTALQVAISESPRRGGVNKSLATTVADTVTAAIDAVRANDTACAALVSSLAARVTTQLAPNPGRRSARRAAEDVPSGLQSRGEVDAAPTRVGRRSRPEPAAAGNGPAIPHPMTTPPVAPPPVAPPPVAPRPVAPRPASPPPIAPAAASGLPSRPASGLPSRPVSEPSSRPVSVPSSRPVSVPPPPPGIVPSARPGVPPAEAGEPFRPTLTNAAISSARAERQRTVIPPRPVIRPQEQPSEPATGGTPRSSVTDYSLPMPASRPASDAPPPGSRGNWPLVARAEDREVAAPTSGAAPVPPSGAGQQPAGSGRVRPPWQSDDLPAEPPSLRLVDQQLGTNDETTQFDGRALRLIEGEETERAARGRARRAAPTVTALDRSSAPPVPDEGDGDLLIFAAARSAWFVGQSDDSTPEWESTADTGWRAAEQAASPAVGAETAAGLPKRVPQANLVPGSPLRDERPLRIVRDAASIAAHTTGYFRGWRRGQEIGGYAIGGRPGRQAAGGWDFTRDGGSRDDDYRSAGYQS